MHYYSTIIIVIAIIAVIIYIYIRLRFGFWYYQPVFHIYDLYSYLFPCGIVMHRLPEKNRYTNFINIEMCPFDKMVDSHKIEQCINLIQTHYLRNNDNIFLPKKKHFLPYFKGHNFSSFVSFYWEDEFLVESKTALTVSNKRLAGVMTTRPLHIFINNGRSDAQFYAYYVDYLCVDKLYRKKGIAPQIIQTHDYHQRRLNKKVHVSLFKREGVLTGIVPLCVYSSYGYNIKDWLKPSPMPPIYKIVACTKTNIRFLLDFMKKERRQFNICITADLSNILSLIESGNIYIYFLLDTTNETILSAYFFKKTCVYISKNNECICCFASICSKATENALFMDGFFSALFSIKQTHLFGFLSIEDISHNKKVITFFPEKPMLVSPVAYFFYNFVYHTFLSSTVLIIGT